MRIRLVRLVGGKHNGFSADDNRQWHGVARRGQLRAGAALIARGEFSLIIIGLAGKSLPAVAALATSYVFIMAIVGPILARYTGAPRAPGAAPAT